MPKLTKDTFDYDKWYSLNTLAEVFNCRWSDTPENSNGIISKIQKVQMDEASQQNHHVQEFTELEWYGGVRFGCNHNGMTLHDTIFKIIPNEPILDIRGI